MNNSQWPNGIIKDDKILDPIRKHRMCPKCQSDELEYDIMSENWEKIEGEFYFTSETVCHHCNYRVWLYFKMITVLELDEGDQELQIDPLGL